jgi:hypothetical protein
LHQKQLALGDERAGLRHTFRHFFNPSPRIRDDCSGFAAKLPALAHRHRPSLLPFCDER